VQHSLNVALILAEMHLQPAVIAARLLHDTVEDTPLTLAEIRADFGEDPAGGRRRPAGASACPDGNAPITATPRACARRFWRERRRAWC
jgi:hypothetical protein